MKEQSLEVILVKIERFNKSRDLIELWIDLINTIRDLIREKLKFRSHFWSRL